MANIFYLIRSSIDSCSPSERCVADFILRSPEIAMTCGVAEMAQKSGTSTAAVVRLCKRMQLGGFHNLKMMLARDYYAISEEKPLPSFEFTKETPTSEIMHNIIKASLENFENCEKLMNPDAIEAAADAIIKARAVHLCGLGASGVVAMDLHQKLSRLGIASTYNEDPHLQITRAAIISNQDVLICFSYSGETREVIHCAKLAANANAPTISITRAGPSPLQKVCMHNLVVPSNESLLRTGATLSRFSELLVVDVLYATIVSRNAEFYLNNISETHKAVQFTDRAQSEHKSDYGTF